MNDLAPTRSWFSLLWRTLLVIVILVAIAQGFASYNLHWIAQRQAFRAAHAPTVYPTPRNSPVMMCCIPNEVPAPWTLRMFGEWGGVNFERRKLTQADLEEGMRLFPETNWGKPKPRAVSADDLRPFT